MCMGRTLSLMPNVAKAVKTAFAIDSNRDHEWCASLRPSGTAWISSRSIFSHHGNSTVGIPFFRL